MDTIALQWQVHPAPEQWGIHHFGWTYWRFLASPRMSLIGATPITVVFPGYLNGIASLTNISGNL